MKWYKHEANARHDARLQKVRLKYGLEGYGLYFWLLECIAGNVEPHNLTFILEEDSELISAATGIHKQLTEEMMVFMVDLGLFENNEGIITCLKMATKTDEYTQKLIRNSNSVRTLSGETPEKVPPNRIDKNRIEQKNTRRFTPPTVSAVQEYLDSRGITDFTGQEFVDHYASANWMRGKTKITSWKHCVGTWLRNRKTTATQTQEVIY